MSDHEDKNADRRNLDPLILTNFSTKVGKTELY